VSLDHVQETSAGVYYQNDMMLIDKVRAIAGIRGDMFRFEDRSDITSTTVTKSSGVLSPKLSLIFGPWADTELFLNGGYGYHSNDARGVTQSADAATALVVTRGAEIGVRTQAVQHLQSSLAFWMMDSDSELVFAGDTGGTEPTGPARRMGIEWTNYWTPKPWFILDADFALSQARYKNPAESGGAYLPEAMEQTASIGATVTGYKEYFGGMRLRYFGSRALIEDNSVRSQPSTLVNLKVGRHFGKQVDLSCDVLNLFNTKTYDIEYYYESQMRSESSSVNDHMVHSGEPRSIRVTLSYKY
jgi:outer membrane receptor protein involved in Fe transport